MSEHRRVLVCDDDSDVRRILVTALRQKALIADEAVDGREAIDLLHGHHYSVVLLDLMMPGVDGFAVLDAIHSESRSPVVLVVSGAGKKVLERVDSSKVHGVIKKPFDPLEIAEIVAACADIRARGTLETMAYATVFSGVPLIALLNL